MGEQRSRRRRKRERRAAKAGVTTRVRDGKDEPKRIRHAKERMPGGIGTEDGPAGGGTPPVVQ